MKSAISARSMRWVVFSARSAGGVFVISVLLGSLVAVRPLGVGADGAATSATSGTGPIVDDPCGTKGQNNNGTVLPGCGGWQAVTSKSTRNIRLIYDVGHQVKHGIAEMDVTNFEP